MLVCWWWWFDWSFARLIAPVVTTTSIILCFTKQTSGLRCGRFWAMSVALVTVRLWRLRSSRIVYNHVIRGRPGSLLQLSSGDITDDLWCSHCRPFMQYGRTGKYARGVHRGSTGVLAPQLLCPFWAPGCKNWPAPFPGQMSYKATKPGLVTLCAS